jgi:hypothetical protein
MGTWVKQGILKERGAHGQWIHKEVFNFPGYKADENQNNRFHLTPVRMAMINGNNYNKCFWGCGKTGTFIHCWWECKLVQLIWKALWRFLKKLEIELLYDPVIPLLGIYPKEHKQDTVETPVHWCL